MVCEKAIRDAEYLEGCGVRLTAFEVLRLNELGIRSMRGASNYDEMAGLPRAVKVGGAMLTEPSIYAEAWAADVMETYAAETALDVFLVRFAIYIVPAEDLPPRGDFKAVEALIKTRVFPVIAHLPFSQCLAIQRWLAHDDGVLVDADETKGDTVVEDGVMKVFGADGELAERKNHALALMCVAKAESIPLGIDDYMALTAGKVAAIVRQHERMHPEIFGKPDNGGEWSVKYSAFLAELEKRIPKNGAAQS